MSLNATRLRPESRKLCACGKRALFVSPSSGRVRWRADHALCFRCYRSHVASVLATRIRPRRAFGWGALNV